MQTHEVHSEVKPVRMLSEPSSSLHMSRQMFTGSQVTTQATLSLFALKFPLIWASSRVAKTGGNYLQIKASIAQKLPGRNGSFLHIL